MTTPTTPGVPAPAGADRTPERRGPNRGNPEGRERRSLADRRAEHNGQYVTFRLHETVCFLGILQVREVLRIQEMTRVPRATALIAGLINLRGEIVPAIDLRPTLGREGALQESDMLVVLREEDGAYALVVDEVHDVLEISPTMIVAPPPNLPAALRPITDGVCKLPDGLMLALDAAGIARIVDAGAQD